MKKLFFTLALALGLAASVSAQETGLFGYGPSRGGYEDYSTDYENRNEGLLLPGSHGSDQDENAPLGMGTFLMLGFGAAYLAKKRTNKE